MSNDETTHRILGRIESELSQIKSSVSNLQRDMSEIAGGLAVVLNRTDENRDRLTHLDSDFENMIAELEASKKKHPAYKNKFKDLANISLPDLQMTRAVLQQWRAQHLSRRM